MRTLLIAISAAALGLAGCATSGTVGRCPPQAKVVAKAKAAPKVQKKAPPKAMAKAKPVAKRGAKRIAKPAADRAPLLSALLAKAKAANEPLLLQFSTSWCVACKMFDKAFVPTKPVAFLLKKTLYVVYDAEHGAGRLAAGRFAIDAYPTFLLFTPSGHLVWHQMGTADTPADFADALDVGLARALSKKAIAAMAAGHPSGFARLLVAAWDVHHGKTDDARRQLRAAERSDPKGTRGVAPRALQMRLELRQGARFAKSAAKADLTMIRRYPDSGAASAAFTDLMGLTPKGSPEARTAAKAMLHADAHDAYMLNQLVYTLIGAGLPKLALKAARAQVALGPGDFNAYDTLGEALGANGQKKAAAKAGTKAVQMARAKKVNPGLVMMLAADQARYANGGPSPSIADGHRERARYRAVLSRVDVQTLLRARTRGWHPRPQQRFQVTLAGALLAAGRACRADAGTLKHAWVVLRLNVAGGAPVSVRMSEPDASAALTACLLPRLKGMKLPKDPAMRYFGDQFVVARRVPLDL